ncbi:hypothetical protein cand_007860 [Cryptosporidium andersoni]|uniref:Uncharacterized protein n=1 Tax=Cryptosporidium andersoni TaxID=117008 RepID=A0A1J4MPE0_9CRYT|nr:hypothetical protein cand_007860 [Cryptosporidium andersoni]
MKSNYPEKSLVLLNYLSEIIRSNNEYIFLHGIDFIDTITIGANNLDNITYIETEKYLVICNQFKNSIITEILEYISDHKARNITIQEYCVKLLHSNYNKKNITRSILYPDIIISEVKFGCIFWDLISLLILLDSSNPTIWCNRYCQTRYLLNFESDMSNKIKQFFEYEVVFVRIALDKAPKSSEIWDYLEYLTKNMLSLTINMNELTSDTVSNGIIIVEWIKNFHSNFLQHQLDNYPHHYYAWGFTRWLIFDLYPDIFNNYSFELDNINELFDKWVISLLLRNPFHYGGYHVLLKLMEMKLKKYVALPISVEYIMNIVFTDNIRQILEQISWLLSGTSHNESLSTIITFRQGLFNIILDVIYIYANSEFGILLFFSEVDWVNKNLIPNISHSEKSLQQIKLYLICSITEICDIYGSEVTNRSYREVKLNVYLLDYLNKKIPEIVNVKDVSTDYILGLYNPGIF